MRSAVQSMRSMSKAVDPKGDILSRLEGIRWLESIATNRLLVATYVLPEKTAGGILLPDRQIEESRYQGKVGLVIRKGNLAFVDDERTKFAGFDPQVGDWVFYRPSNGFEMFIKDVHRQDMPCRMLADIDIMGRITDPDAIW